MEGERYFLSITVVVDTPKQVSEYLCGYLHPRRPSTQPRDLMNDDTVNVGHRYGHGLPRGVFPGMPAGVVAIALAVTGGVRRRHRPATRQTMQQSLQQGTRG